LCQSHSSHLPETLGEQQEEQHDLRWGALQLSLLMFGGFSGGNFTGFWFRKIQTMLDIPSGKVT